MPSLEFELLIFNNLLLLPQQLGFVDIWIVNDFLSWLQLVNVCVNFAIEQNIGLLLNILTNLDDLGVIRIWTFYDDSSILWNVSTSAPPLLLLTFTNSLVFSLSLQSFLLEQFLLAH